MSSFNLQLRSLKMLKPVEMAEVIASVVEALVTANMSYLRNHPGTPRLCFANITYKQTGDLCYDIPALLETKEGDCKSLVAWRIAEARLSGLDARPHIMLFQKGKAKKFHVQVSINGKLHDPSQECGMKTA